MAKKKTTKKASKAKPRKAAKAAAKAPSQPVFLEAPAIRKKAEPVSPEELRKRKGLARKVTKAMHELYPDADCELRHESALQLLVATILSAQCTDKMVNKVTESLFRKYRTAGDFAKADLAVFEQEIRSTGTFRRKANAVIETCKQLVELFGGGVPDTMEDMLRLEGVARKTANVVLGTAYGIPTGVVVDTHVKRLAVRIGLSDQKMPEKIEMDLMEVLPEDEWIFMGHAIIWHGRRVCDAKKPRCSECVIAKVCEKKGVEESG